MQKLENCVKVVTNNSKLDNFLLLPSPKELNFSHRFDIPRASCKLSDSTRRSASSQSASRLVYRIQFSRRTRKDRKQATFSTALSNSCPLSGVFKLLVEARLIERWDQLRLRSSPPFGCSSFTAVVAARRVQRSSVELAHSRSRRSN